MIEKDFYVDERGAASYFEKDWADHFTDFKFHFAEFDRAFLYSDYHERFVQFLKARMGPLAPQRMLEIGSGMGRGFYEVCRQLDTIENAVLVEPSKNLLAVFNSLFSGNRKVLRLPVLFGNVDRLDATIDTGPLQAACAGVQFSTLNLPFQEIPADLRPFDLVICSNVIDQCVDPEKLIELVQRSTRPGGVLALSCTYQWQEKYIGNAVREIKNTTEFFSGGWTPLGETNIPFQCRKYERHWLGFLSHVIVLQRHA
jgi:SAM-dependent methyltransferase